MKLRNFHKSLLTYWELKGVVDTARDEGHEAGRLQGKLEGKLEGRLEEKLEIAQKMKQQGFNTEIIQQITGITADEIEKLP